PVRRSCARELYPVCNHLPAPLSASHCLKPCGACGSGRRPTLVAYLFLLPSLALLAVFTFYPVVFGPVLGLFEYHVINPPRYVGLQQFQRLLSDRYFWIALTNSAKYVRSEERRVGKQVV